MRNSTNTAQSGTAWLAVVAILAMVPNLGAAPAEAQGCTGCQWEQRSEMPTPRLVDSGSIAAIDGKISVIGHHDGNPGSGRVNEQYDPATDSWISLTPLPRVDGRLNFASAVVNGEMYIFGGANIFNNYHTQTIDKFDAANDVWTTDVGTLPVRTGGSAATAVGGLIYLFGGSEYNAPGYDAAHEFDPSNGQIAALEPMPEPRVNARSFEYGGEVWIAGGHGGHPSVTLLGSVDIYDPVTDSWRSGPQLPRADWLSWAGVLDGEIFVVYFGPSPEIYWYDQSQSTWQMACTGPTPRPAGYSVAAVDGRLHVIGGGDPKIGLHEAFIPGCVSDSGVTLACSGFRAPADQGPITVHGPRAIPLKAELFDEYGGLVTDLDLPLSPLVQVTFQPPSGGTPINVSSIVLPPFYGTPGNTFRYHRRWRFNLRSRNYTSPGSYLVEMISGAPDDYVIAPRCSVEFVVP